MTYPSNPFSFEQLLKEADKSLSIFRLGSERSLAEALMSLAFAQGRLCAAHERYERDYGEQYQLDAIADSNPKWRSQ